MKANQITDDSNTSLFGNFNLFKPCTNSMAKIMRLLLKQPRLIYNKKDKRSCNKLYALKRLVKIMTKSSFEKNHV